MASLQELSQLSAFAYFNGGVDPTKSLPLGWEVYLSAQGNELDGGYYGVAYRNPTTGEIIIAHRGSQLTPDDWENDADAFLGQPLPQFNAAQAFSNRAIQTAETQGLLTKPVTRKKGSGLES